MPRDPVTSDASRIARLTARVRWFDRYRRWIAIACAVVLSPFMIGELETVVGVAWPLVFSALFAVMLGVIVWWIVEVAMAWMIALWETQADELSRSAGLPRAEIIQRRN